MHWYVAGSFITRPTDPWLLPYAQRSGRDYTVVPAAYAVDRSRPVAGLAEWRVTWQHARQTWRALRAGGDAKGGLLTIFPQLAMAAAGQKRLQRADEPIVAWCFNVGSLYDGARRTVARLAARAIDTYVVHSRAEIEAYSHWLGIPPERFQFVPLQRPSEPVTVDEVQDKPFVLAMGSARRDYPLLAAALRRLGLPAVIVAAEHALEGADLPANVTVHHRLTAKECERLTQQARLCVVPVANRDTASGQVTVIDAMMFGRPVIATRCVGTIDYVDHGVDGWLVEQGSLDELTSAIETLWHDEPRRRALGEAARRRVALTLSDTAAGQALDHLLQRFE